MENSEIGTLIGTVEAMDIDSGTFGEIEYTLYGNDTDRYNYQVKLHRELRTIF